MRTSDIIIVQRHQFLLILAITFSAICPVRADENTRALQARLKEDGFYFGEVNGENTSETAAAVTRYQIRHGLEISGQLDGKTAKSLGISPPATDAPTPRTDSETWRRLRKSDEQFLKKLDANQRPASSPQAHPSKTITAPPPATDAGANPEFAQTFVLSRERLRDYVAAFVLAGLDPSVAAELEFFADRVKYFNQGTVDREKIRRDLQRYNQRWPTRRFWLDGEVEIQPQPDSRLRVTFPLRYELRNGSKHSSGRVRKTLVVEVTGEDLQIVAVNERR